MGGHRNFQILVLLLLLLSSIPFVSSHMGFVVSMRVRVRKRCTLIQEPLLLYASSYESLFFKRTPQAFRATRDLISAKISRQLVGLGHLAAFWDRLNRDAAQMEFGNASAARQSHAKLLSRATEPPLADKLAKYGKKL
jgi:hypothetical protein